MKLSILICTIPSREEMLKNLVTEVVKQSERYNAEVQILMNGDPDGSVGAKRNWLLGKAEGEYLCFLDDDDMIDRDYIELLMEAAESGKDCASLLGLYIVDGRDEGVFEHSIKHRKWETVEGAPIKYLRCPNHLNLIKSSIAKQFKFPEKNHGEDADWSMQIQKSGLLKTEHYIDEIIYYYQFNSKK